MMLSNDRLAGCLLLLPLCKAKSRQGDIPWSHAATHCATDTWPWPACDGLLLGSNSPALCSGLFESRQTSGKRRKRFYASAAPVLHARRPLMTERDRETDRDRDLRILASQAACWLDLLRAGGPRFAGQAGFLPPGGGVPFLARRAFPARADRAQACRGSTEGRLGPSSGSSSSLCADANATGQRLQGPGRNGWGGGLFCDPPCDRGCPGHSCSC